MAAVHPSALNQDWSLRSGPPLKSPKASERTYLSCIVSGALPWCVTWGSQILSALAWVQLALQCGYPRHTALRAMHKLARRVFSASPWCSDNTMRAVFAVSHHMPAPRHLVVQKLACWLRAHTVWDMHQYTDQEIPPQVRPEAYTAPWSSDFALLLQLSFSPAPPGPVCL